jgi:hypothetical protein
MILTEIEYETADLSEETSISIFDTSYLNKENTLIVSKNRLSIFPCLFFDRC